MKNRLFIILVLITTFSTFNYSQSTPESCDCLLDTIGFNVYLNSLAMDEDAPLTFEVENASSKFSIMHGVIDGTTPTVVQNFIDNFPNITTLVFMQMPGSDDDTSNLQASQLLKDRGYTTYLPGVIAFNDDAFIASGAVDMFLAGNRRVIDVTGEVGVHAWSDGVNEATDFPVGDPVHFPYINYYVSMGFSQADAEAFYYFTINAAPANGIHYMTEGEIEQYKLRTCIYNNTPNYEVIVNNATLSANLSGANYQWLDCNNGNAPINGATEQSYTPTITGNYAVQITEINCAGTSACYPVTVSEILIQNTGISIFPNTTENDLTIELSSGNYTVQILDGTGNVHSTISFTNNLHTIDITQLPVGLYFLYILDNVNNQTTTNTILQQ